MPTHTHARPHTHTHTRMHTHTHARPHTHTHTRMHTHTCPPTHTYTHTHTHIHTHIAKAKPVAAVYMVTPTQTGWDACVPWQVLVGRYRENPPGDGTSTLQGGCTCLMDEVWAPKIPPEQ